LGVPARKTGGFKTTDGLPINADGSNGIPAAVKNVAVFATPTTGVIIEF
jgi:hypothetical protein